MPSLIKYIVDFNDQGSVRGRGGGNDKGEKKKETGMEKLNLCHYNKLVENYAQQMFFGP